MVDVERQRNSVERGQTKHRVDDLNFCLYRRAIHPELFDIREVRRAEQRRYNAEIWVTGLSHVITFQYGDHIVTELIAEEGDMLPKMGLVTSFRFRGERDHAQDFNNGVNYILSTQVERMTPQLYPATHRDYMHYGKTRGIYVEFEEWTHDGLQPFSFIDFDARDREFHVHAFHLFPEDMTILKTQSIFEVPETPPTPPTP